jgi:hypothetical protein
MSSESYLARWNAYLNTFNQNLIAENLESAESQADDKSESGNLIVESTEEDGKQVGP